MIPMRTKLDLAILPGDNFTMDIEDAILLTLSAAAYAPAATF
jgi:hypothetical protein